MRSLHQLREIFYKSPKYIPLERMPPTSRAACFHLLRVHRQVSTWKKLGTILPLDGYGFVMQDNNIVPIITDKAAAPDELLRSMRCACCSKDKRCLTQSCGCKKRRMPCSVHCKCEGQCHNPSLVDNSS